jgi:hypothetical protein
MVFGSQALAKHAPASAVNNIPLSFITEIDSKRNKTDIAIVSAGYRDVNAVTVPGSPPATYKRHAHCTDPLKRPTQT